VLIDMPVGLTAKVRSAQAAPSWATSWSRWAQALGLQVRVLQTDGVAPVGRGIGPALEARDVLAVLRRDARCPGRSGARARCSWRDSCWSLAARRRPGPGPGPGPCGAGDGRAWQKFQAICEAQGGLRTPPVAAYRQPVLARHSGTVIAIDNRRLARIAKLAGAPSAACAGIDMHVQPGAVVTRGQPLFTLHAATPANWPTHWNTPPPRPRPCM
jgi:thymidine phosphorylase